MWFGINFSYYGAFIWLPTLLVSRGFGLVKSFGYTLVITLAQLPGYAVAAWLIEVWGRRITLAVFLAGSAVAAGLFGLAASFGRIASIIAPLLVPVLLTAGGSVMVFGAFAAAFVAAVAAFALPERKGVALEEA